jgi:hypothetical protein
LTLLSLFRSRCGCCTGAPRPNFVILFADDLGYGDLVFRINDDSHAPGPAAREERLLKFLRASGLRAVALSLADGPSPGSRRWMVDAGERDHVDRAIASQDTPACIGGDVSNRAAVRDRMPNAKGFDFYYGPLGANDNGNVVIYENNDEIERTDDMGSLTRKYTDKAIDFVKANRDKPFLLYVAHTMVHSVVGASPDFRGKSQGGLYGDAVEEMDFYAGRLLDTLDALGQRDNTLVIFTSDNGAWNNFKGAARQRRGCLGSSGPLRWARLDLRRRAARALRRPLARTGSRTASAMRSLRALTSCRRSDLSPAISRRWIASSTASIAKLLMGKPKPGRNVYHYFCQNGAEAVVRVSKLHLSSHKVFMGT